MKTRIQKWLLLGVLAGTLQGCVTYQSPSYDGGSTAGYASADGLYGDVYDEVAPNLSISFADAAFYPWWSVDYYYLGRHYYRPGYWNRPHYSFGAVPPHYWPYYGFYTPMYHPYATYPWYNPRYGWPRYGYGLDVYWQEIYWATRYQNRTTPGQPDIGNNTVGNTSAAAFSDAFYDHRDRAPDSPVAPGSRSTAPYSMKRSVSAPPTTGVTGTPRVVGQARAPQARRAISSPGVSAPRPAISSPAVSAPRTGPSRPTSVPRASASKPAGPAHKTGKRKNN